MGTDITDHFPNILFQHLNSFKQNSKQKKKYTYKRNYTEANLVRFKKSLASVNWADIMDGQNAEVDYNNFISKFNELYEECVPLK